MSRKDLIKEILRLTSRTVQPEDTGIQGWEPIAVNRLDLIQNLALMNKEHFYRKGD